MGKPWLKFYEEGVPPQIDYPDIPLHSILEEVVGKYPHHVALIFQGQEITYQELGKWVTHLASALAHLGVKKGERIAIMLPNCPQYVVAYYAILKNGGIVVNVNPMYVERELEFQLKDAGVESILALRDFYPRLEAVREAVGLKRIILTSLLDTVPQTPRDIPRKGGTPPIYEYADLLARGKHLPWDPIEVKGDEAAVLQYTGGTTGFSKGAILTHRNLVTNVIKCVNWNRGAERGKERMLAVIPFFHVYGMTVAMNEAIYLAAAIILLPRFNVDDTLEVIHRYRPTRFPGVPTMYIALLNHPRLQQYNLASIKVCSSGSAPMPIEALRRFEELTGGKISEGYGLTEASPVTHSNPFTGKRKVGSIGLPRPDTDAKIVDLETGAKELPPGKEGELCIRGPQVMQGYWKRPAETEATLRKGWLHTGDIARMDEEGYFYIVDRKKDMILCGGFNVYPREVEEVLYEYPKIQETCAVGVPDSYRGETVKVFVVLKQGESASSEEIVDFCRQKLARYKVPTIVEFRTELPKSHVGKILRKILREEEERKKGLPSPG
jgi:long-chain acyl-CoA synthetase